MTTPKLEVVYKINGDTQNVYDVPEETAVAVGDFVVPKRHRRDGAREASFMYAGVVASGYRVVL